MTPFPLYLYRIEPSRPEMLAAGATPADERAVGDHFEYLRELTEAGVVLLAGRTLNTDPSAFGIVIFRAADDAAARRVVDADPAVAAGVFRAELFPYRIALVGPELRAGIEADRDGNPELRHG